MNQVRINGVTLENLTPHDINIIQKDGLNINIAQCPNPPRTSQIRNEVGEVAGIKINEVSFGKTKNLPEPKESTYYIVSRIIKESASHRQDLIVPDETLRNEKGIPIGCKAFAL